MIQGVYVQLLCKSRDWSAWVISREFGPLVHTRECVMPGQTSGSDEVHALIQLVADFWMGTQQYVMI